ncbi:MAG: MFS transporter [Chloroflexota bacterium]
MRLARSQTRSVEHTNNYHLVMDIAWFGIALAATSRFLSIYAIHLQASAMEIALLTALPAIVLLISSLFGGWWRARYHNTVHALFWPGLMFRFMFFMLALTPLLPHHLQTTWLILAVTIPAVPQGVAGVIFLVMLREAVNTDRVTRLVSHRAAAFNIGIAFGALGCGLWLEAAPFPINYQVMFLVAFLAALVSWWHVNRVRDLLDDAPPATVALPQPLRVDRRAAWRSPALWQMAFLTGITHLSLFIIFPVVPIHMVDNLHASEGFIALFGMAELAGGALMALYANTLSSRLGERLMIVYGMMVIGIAALLVALAPALWVTLIAALLMGGAWAVVGIGVFANMTRSAPAEHATLHAMIFSQTVGLATFLGPIIGSGLVEIGISVVTVMLFGAAVRFTAALLVALQPHAIAPRLSVRRMLANITTINQ